MKIDYPKHAYPSARAFKAKKRADARAALKALDQLLMGCYYTPTDGKIVQARDLVKECITLMSAKKWGR